MERTPNILGDIQKLISYPSSNKQNVASEHKEKTVSCHRMREKPHKDEQPQHQEFLK